MLSEELKSYVQGESAGIQIGIAPVDGLAPQEITDLSQLNIIMSRYTPFYSADASVFQPQDFSTTPQRWWCLLSTTTLAE